MLLHRVGAMFFGYSQQNYVVQEANMIQHLHITEPLKIMSISQLLTLFTRFNQEFENLCRGMDSMLLFVGCVGKVFKPHMTLNNCRIISSKYSKFFETILIKVIFYSCVTYAGSGDSKSGISLPKL